MKIVVIAAIGRNGELGKDGKLPWHLPADLQHFKRITDGQVVVMGRKTYESLPKKLENRTIIVVTTQTDYKAEDALVFNSIGEVMHYAHTHDLETLYVAGGGEIYKHFLPLADAMILTKVAAEYDADTYFHFNENEWESKSITTPPEGVQGEPKFYFEYYERGRSK
jgi:dihydrofolate reductase